MGGIIIITVSPYILFTLIIVLISDSFKLCIIAYLCAILHELGHIFTARHFGYSINNVKLLPIGVCCELNEDIKNKTHLFYVAVAGPAVNLMIMLLALMFNFDSSIVMCNMYIMILNLLPISPLDGGKLLHTFIDDEIIERCIEIFTYTFIILNSFYSFIKCNSFNLSLIWILIFTLFNKKTNVKKRNDRTEIEFLNAESRVIDVLDINNYDKTYIILENKKILGIVSYKDIYLAALEGQYYSYTKELLTERT